MVAFGECGFAAEIPAFAGMEVFFYPPPLAGGVKIRASEFLGGGEVPTIVGNTPPPATASRSHPPPASGGG